MFCVSGFAGVGKDEFCKRLVTNHGAYHTGLIDPAKRHLAEVYDFSEDQLFGPSHFRNAGDIRYPKHNYYSSRLRPLDKKAVTKWEIREPKSDHLYYTQDFFVTDYSFIGKDGSLNYVVEQGDARFWLSPREALQLHGELLNDLYMDTWIQRGVNVHLSLATGKYIYSRMGGLIPKSNPPSGESIVTCFSDFRHVHEIEYVRRLPKSVCIPLLVRIKSKRVPNPIFTHRSEVEQTRIPDAKFNVVLHNDGNISELHHYVDELVEKAKNGSINRDSFIEVFSGNNG
jgi:hypothetical protein